MPKANKVGFADTDLELEPYDRSPVISDDIQQSLTRLMGWDDNNNIWRSALVDVEGKLKVSSSATQTDIASNGLAVVGVASIALAAANPDRRQIIIQNKGTVAIYIGFGVTPVVGTHFEIPVNGTFADDVFTGIINAIASLAAQNVIVVEM